jgi:hypothetical protein
MYPSPSYFPHSHPPLPPNFVVSNFGYVLNCRHRAQLDVLPASLQLDHIAKGLYKITGLGTPRS